MKWLWLKHSYTFRWAHKPLCERFHEDRLQIGKMHICRGCMFLYFGLIAAFVFFMMTKMELLPVIAGLCFVVLPLSYPALYKPLPRVIKDVLRFALGALFAGVFLLLFTLHWWVGVILAVVFYGYRRLINQKRMRMKANVCEGCPELGKGQVCSGYQLQAECARRFDEEASMYLQNQYHPSR